MEKMAKLITAIDAAYLPALVALYNSFKANAGDRFEFVCMVHGTDELACTVRAMGIKVLRMLDLCDYLPTTARWPVASPAMFSRLLIPRLFPDPDENTIWIDADCIILKPLDGLLEIEFCEPVAAVRTSTVTLAEQVGGLPARLRQVPALFAGLMIFNTTTWNALCITQVCQHVMSTRPDLDFYFAVQSVLSFVLAGDFHEIDYKWQGFAGRGPFNSDCRIGHWVGALPWAADCYPHNREIWEKYAA